MTSGFTHAESHARGHQYLLRCSAKRDAPKNSTKLQYNCYKKNTKKIKLFHLKITNLCNSHKSNSQICVYFLKTIHYCNYQLFSTGQRPLFKNSIFLLCYVLAFSGIEMPETYKANLRLSFSHSQTSIVLNKKN